MIYTIKHEGTEYKSVAPYAMDAIKLWAKIHGLGSPIVPLKAVHGGKHWTWSTEVPNLDNTKSFKIYARRHR